jgi:anti-anti-sigma factor
MRIKIEKKEDITTIRIIDRVMVTDIDELEKELEDISDTKEIHFDLSRTEYCCSAFLGVIVAIKKRYPQIEFKLLYPNDFLIELFNISGVKKLFNIVPAGKK